MTRLLSAASVVCVVAVCGFAFAAYALARASEWPLDNRRNGH